MQRLDVLAEACAGLVGEHRGGVLAQDRKGDLCHRRGRGDRCRHVLGRLRDDKTGAEEAGLELRQRRRLQPALASQLLDERRQRVDPRRQHLDFDPLQADPMVFLTSDDHRVVKGYLADGRPADLQRVGAAASPDFEHLAEVPRSCERLHPPADRAERVEPVE